jgi:hypothetical protein
MVKWSLSTPQVRALCHAKELSQGLCLRTKQITRCKILCAMAHWVLILNSNPSECYVDMISVYRVFVSKDRPANACQNAIPPFIRAISSCGPRQFVASVICQSDTASSKLVV